MQDRAGNETSCTFQVIRAPLGFTGFFPPVNGADASGGSFESPVKTFRLGSTIPLKFRAHCGGSPVTIGEHTLEAAKFSSSSSAEEPIDATPADGASTENRFRHTGNGEWHYNLDTRQSGMSRGVWQLVATLSDGSRHAVWVQLK